jgi:hypothetical protein
VALQRKFGLRRHVLEVAESHTDIHPVGLLSTTDHRCYIHATDLAQSTALLTEAKLKQYLHRPGQAHVFAGGLGLQISRKTAHEDGKFVSHKHRPPLTSSKYSGTHFFLESESTPVLY